MKTRTIVLVVAVLASCKLTAAELPYQGDSSTQAEPATKLDWSVKSALTHTDNVTLVETDPISENIGSVGGKIDLTREGSRLNATLRGDGSFLHYFNDTYSNDFLGSAAASLRIGLIADALIWNLDDAFGQSITDEFQPSTPNNRGNVNTFSTGPELHLRVGATNELVIEGRYEDSSYEESSSSDSHTWSGDAAVVHRVSPSVAWSLHANASHVDYDTTETPGYDQQEVFVRLDARRASQDLTADLGMAFLDGTDQSEQKPLVRLNWRRRLTPSWKVDLDAATGYENAGQQFATGVAGVAGDAELGGTQDIILTNQVHQYDRANISLSFERPRTTLSLTGGVDREKYPDASDLNRDMWSLGAEASRRLTEHVEAMLNADYEQRTFQDPADDDNTTTITLGIDWRLGKAVFLGLKGGTQRRSGNTSFSYDETLYQASITYRPRNMHGPREP